MYMKYIFIFLAMAGMALSFQSCSQDLEFYQYKLSVANIFSAYLFEDQSKALDDSTGRYLMLGAGDSIMVIDTETDSIVNTIKTPFTIPKIIYFSFPERNCFALYIDSVFWAYKNGTFYSHKLDPVLARCYVFRSTKIQYFPRYDLIIFNSMPYNARNYPRDMHYSWNVFTSVNMITHEVRSLDIRPPSIYFGGKMEIPYIYTSQSDSRYLIASFSYDRNVYKYDVATGALEQVEIYYEGDDLNPIPTYNLKKDKARDTMQKSWVVDDAYYCCFYNASEDSYCRIYKPRMPYQTDSGAYLGYLEKPCMIIKKQNGKTRNYFLPNGIFLVPQHWFGGGADLKFVKNRKLISNEKIWQTTVYTINLFNF